MNAIKVPYYLLPHENGWAIRQAETQRISEFFPDRAEAEKAGQEAAYQADTVLIVYDESGQIERIDNPEDLLRFKPEIQARLERHLRGEEELVDFDEAMQALGLDE